ncbi:hypothetical protein D3C81_2096190 [compost metagenome]
MTETHGITLAATGRDIHQRAGYRSCRGNRHRRGAHHRVVQLAHGHGTRIEVDIRGGDVLVAAGHVCLRRRHEHHLRRVLALERLFR